MLNIKLMKPEKKFYRISYAMLNNICLEPKIDVNSSANSPTKTSKIPVVKTPKIPKPPTVKSPTKSSLKNKYDILIDEMVNKGIIDLEDSEVKLLELQTLSDEEFDKYAEKISLESNEVITSIKNINSLDDLDKIGEEETEIQLTEAEKALARIKSSGPVIGDFSDENNAKTIIAENRTSETRSLSDIRAERHLNMNVTEDDICGNLNIEDTLQTLKESNNRRKSTAMSNLQGLKRPIVQQNTEKTMKNIFSDFNWTMGGR